MNKVPDTCPFQKKPCVYDFRCYTLVNEDLRIVCNWFPYENSPDMLYMDVDKNA